MPANLVVVIRGGVVEKSTTVTHDVNNNRIKIVYDGIWQDPQPIDIINSCRAIYMAIYGRMLYPAHPVDFIIGAGANLSFDADALLQCHRGVMAMPPIPPPASALPPPVIPPSVHDPNADLVARLRAWIEKNPNGTPTLYPVNDKEWQKVVNWVNSVCNCRYTRDELVATIQTLRKSVEKPTIN